jgi:hypothetical protein
MAPLVSERVTNHTEYRVMIVNKTSYYTKNWLALLLFVFSLRHVSAKSWPTGDISYSSTTVIPHGVHDRFQSLLRVIYVKLIITLNSDIATQILDYFWLSNKKKLND